MRACVVKTAVLFLMIPLLPVEFAARCANGEGCLQEDQNIGVRDLLPHGLHVGMFLGDVAAGITILFEPGDQSRFSRTAGTNDTDQEFTTWRLHI